MDDPTFSGRVEVARVCRVAVAVLALAFGAMFVALGVEPDQIILGLVLIGLTVAVSLLGLLTRIPFPELLPHTERFGALLASAVFPVTGIVVTAGLSVLWFNLTWPKLVDMYYQVGAAPQNWGMGALLCLIIFLPLLGGFWLAAALARLAPWRVRGDAAGGLRIWFASRYYTFNPAELRVWRVEAGPAGRVVALHLSDGRRTVILPAGSARSRQGVFIDQLAEWLRERGAEVVAGRPVAAGPEWWGWARQAALCCAMLACVYLPWGVVRAGLFWGEWIVTGTYSAMFTLKALPWCALVGILYLASPLLGWLGRLFGGLWLEGKPPAGLWRVTVIEGLHANKVFSTSARSGLIGAEGEVLRLVVGKKEYHISREAILELKACSLIRKILDYTSEPFYRFVACPIRLAWRAEEDGGQVIHSVLIAARGAANNGRERWLDRELYRGLTAWLRGEEPLDFSNLKSASARLGALAAALFIIFCLIVPPIHNHLIRTRIATGLWPPPARPLPASELMPFISDDTASISPEGMLFLNTFQRNSPAADDFRVPLLYWGDPLRGNLPPVTYGLRLLSSQASSFPGPLTHAWCSGETSLGPLMLPPQLMEESCEFSPSQIIDLRTGRGRRLTSFERLARDSFRPVTALDTGGKHLFYAVDKRAENGEILSRGEFGWVDTASDTLHPAGQLPFERDVDQKPFFFPDHRYVLYQWHVVDLETGSVRGVAPLAEAGWKIDEGFLSYYPLGRSLVRKVTLSQIPNPAAVAASAAIIDPNTGMPLGPSASTSSAGAIDPVTGLPLDPTASGAPGLVSDPNLPATPVAQATQTSSTAASFPAPPAIREEYWAIDPVTAQRRVITLPPGTALLSADEDRWLVAERAPEPPAGKAETEAEKMKRFAIPREFSIFSPTTGRVRALFRERREGRYFLVQGRDEILVWSKKNVWSRRALPPDKKNGRAGAAGVGAAVAVFTTTTTVVNGAH